MILKQFLNEYRRESRASRSEDNKIRQIKLSRTKEENKRVRQKRMTTIYSNAAREGVLDLNFALCKMHQCQIR